MPRSSNQKLKLLKLAEIFREETNEEHPITISRLIEMLDGMDIKAERKSLYDDIDTLCLCGMEIEKTGASRNTGYYYVGGKFELQELKLLADAVACSKFITEKKSEILVEKLSSLTNRFDKAELKRNVIVTDRVKNVNEQIYYNVDTIQRAIHDNNQIRFRYFHLDRKKKKQYHNDGGYSVVSPYALCWSEENYYLIGYYEKRKDVNPFRVDRIESVEIIEDKKRVPKPKGFSLNEYTKKRFSMFSGEDLRVTLRVHNDLSNVIFDRFGSNITIYTDEEDDNYFVINQPVTASSIFYGWVFQFGEKMEIVEPEDVREGFKKYIKKVLNLYK